MIKQTLETALNQQINAEFYSANLYLSMAAWFSAANLPGFANWTRVQFEEEQFHALKFYDYLIQRQGKVLLMAQDAPPTTWESPLNVFQEIYKHEVKVTGLINALMDLAIKESDHAAGMMLQWFINEQVEEEANVDGIVQKLKLVKDNPTALFMMDQELATRVFVPPVAPAA
ncbi:TPA: ferritin [Candidatus Sumerlaeota bacterium]|jgi:ferritin|nr:ferritin [Candidatus Sumerlaeota bacterium]